MSDHDELHAAVDAFQRRIRTIAVVGLVISVCIIAITDFYALPAMMQINRDSRAINALRSLEATLITLLPLVFIAAFITPILEQWNRIRVVADKMKRPSEETTLMSELAIRIERFETHLGEIRHYPGLASFVSSYLEVDWEDMLADAESAEISFFYTRPDWEQRNLKFFRDFVGRGGRLTVYLPNLLGVSSRFVTHGEIGSSTERKILRTAGLFFDIKRQTPNASLSIRTLSRGTNYAWARIVASSRPLFLMSPYQNQPGGSLSPALIIDEGLASDELRSFVESELTLTKDAAEMLDLESLRYTVWDLSRDRIFVSVGLTCPAKCTFCYIYSFDEAPSHEKPRRFGEILARSILNDARFKAGPDGTAVMVGGFSDPLLPDNVEDTVKLIEILTELGNPIHLATRFAFGFWREKLPTAGRNLIINYSLSTLRPGFELPNSEKRFTEAAVLLARGYKVALYLRPIIPGVTLKDTPEIIQRCKAVGIRHVTVGGLYVDTAIRKRLKASGVVTETSELSQKRFVLDKRGTLTKLRTNDEDDISRLFRAANLDVSHSSRDLVDKLGREQQAG